MNSNLNAAKTAKTAKSDEFYTQYQDIDNEVKHYAEHLAGKIVYCNCDNPDWSNFYKYFVDNFERYGLKKLYCSYYDESGSFLTIYTPQRVKKIRLKTGDFRSDECRNILSKVDVVITNPPFSLFREYIAQLVEYDKQFLIIGNLNAVTYKEVFPLIKDNLARLGFHKVKQFTEPDGNLAKFGNIGWFTSLSKKSPSLITLTATYKGNEDKYPHYDNYDAIEVGKVKDIPADYYDLMGVPITFAEKHNREQFEIIDLIRPLLSGKEKYQRLVINRIT